MHSYAYAGELFDCFCQLPDCTADNRRGEAAECGPMQSLTEDTLYYT